MFDSMMKLFVMTEMSGDNTFDDRRFDSRRRVICFSPENKNTAPVYVLGESFLA